MCVVNLAILGTAGSFSYQNWNNLGTGVSSRLSPSGSSALSGLEGYVGKVCEDQELPKH